MLFLLDGCIRRLRLLHAYSATQGTRSEFYVLHQYFSAQGPFSSTRPRAVVGTLAQSFELYSTDRLRGSTDPIPCLAQADRPLGLHRPGRLPPQGTSVGMQIFRRETFRRRILRRETFRRGHLAEWDISAN